MEVITGSSSCPSDVNSYSTDGGDVAITLRLITPRPSRSRNRPLSTFAVIVGVSRRNSENRREPLLKLQMSSGVQRPPTNAVHFDMGQPGSGSTFFRIFKLIIVLQGSFQLVI
jgi:hypothetical protein